MLLWRIWHVHNEITNQKPAPSVEGSRRFLASYMNSLLLIKQFPMADVTKGKMVISHDQVFQTQRVLTEGRQKTRLIWTPPVNGTVKLNVDGAFGCDGAAGAGMVLRDHEGHVIFAACRQL